jgi:hypothetical protein
MQDESIPSENNNIFFRLAENIRDVLGTCVSTILPKKIETDVVPPIPRPSAVVLLNAHGNYPYGLFDREVGPYTRQNKAASYIEYSIGTHINRLVDENSELYKNIISTLFQNVKYTSSVPAPYCGMMVARNKSEDKDCPEPTEPTEFNAKSSREQEYAIVEAAAEVAKQIKSDNADHDKAVLDLFNKMRHDLRKNANIMYYSPPMEIEGDEDLGNFLKYINKMVSEDGLYKAFPLCPKQLDKRYVFRGEDDEDKCFVPMYGFHIWIGDEKYNLLNIDDDDYDDYDRIQNKVIDHMPVEDDRIFAEYVLNDIIKTGMTGETPNLRLSEISLFLWSLKLKDIIISDSACSIVLDMQGSDIITKDNFKTTIGRLFKTVLPQAEESQLPESQLPESPSVTRRLVPVKANKKDVKFKLDTRPRGGKPKRTKRTNRTSRSNRTKRTKRAKRTKRTKRTRRTRRTKRTKRVKRTKKQKQD